MRRSLIGPNCATSAAGDESEKGLASCVDVVHPCSPFPRVYFVRRVPILRRRRSR
jgi:hypothetical protein